MIERYEYKGRVLNGPILRDLLNTAHRYGFYAEGEWVSVRELKDRIEAFHSQKGGLPSELKDFPTNLRDLLWEMAADGKAEVCQVSRPHCWRLV